MGDRDNNRITDSGALTLAPRGTGGLSLVKG